MIGFNDYRIMSQGSKGYNICLPCFHGDGKEFYTASKMNLFYSDALAQIYKYAVSFFTDDVRRVSYTCENSVDFSNDGEQITVTLTLTLRRLCSGDKRYSENTKKITHLWKNGIIMSRKIT